ncbi:hypothetical protein [Paraburkholderia fungorum]|uniref:hypothetical protein n=1 Tax=Paraburkholderia fungorum TaxID=134537 RepID=UPI0016122631|nr:hypothetical protein [Paraburkholderia fungorum]MBB5546632.1 hypothetical protein [Paraburkholderia fungorum]
MNEYVKPCPSCGRRSLAVTEPLDPPPEGWRLDGTLIHRVAGDPHPENYDEIRVTLADGSRDEQLRERLAAQLFASLTDAPPAAITDDWANRCLDAAHTWADQAYAAGKGKPHQSLADTRRALRRLLMEPLAGGAGVAATAQARAPVGDEVSFRDWYNGLSPQLRKVVEAVDPTVATASVAPADPRVDSLSMLVKQLVHSLRRSAPENALAERALDYLRRQGLIGSPLRMDAPDGSESDTIKARGEAA